MYKKIIFFTIFLMSSVLISPPKRLSKKAVRAANVELHKTMKVLHDEGQRLRGLCTETGSTGGPAQKTKRARAGGAVASEGEKASCPKCCEDGEWGAECSCTKPLPQEILDYVKKQGFKRRLGVDGASVYERHQRKDDSCSGSDSDSDSTVSTFPCDSADEEKAGEDVPVSSLYEQLIPTFGANVEAVRETVLSAFKIFFRYLLRHSSSAGHVVDPNFKMLVEWLFEMHKDIQSVSSLGSEYPDDGQQYASAILAFAENLSLALGHSRLKTNCPKRVRARNFLSEENIVASISSVVLVPLLWLMTRHPVIANNLIFEFYSKIVLSIPAELIKPENSGLFSAYLVIQQFLKCMEFSVPVSDAGAPEVLRAADFGSPTAAFVAPAQSYEDELVAAEAAEKAAEAAEKAAEEARQKERASRKEGGDQQQRQAARIAEEKESKKREENRLRDAQRASELAQDLASAATKAEEDSKRQEAQELEDITYAIQQAEREARKRLKQAKREARERLKQAQFEREARERLKQAQEELSKEAETQNVAATRINAVCRGFLVRRDAHNVSSSTVSGSSVSMLPSPDSSRSSDRSDSDASALVPLDPSHFVVRCAASSETSGRIYLKQVDSQLADDLSVFLTFWDGFSCEFDSSHGRALSFILKNIYAILNEVDRYVPENFQQQKACKKIKEFMWKLVFLLLRDCCKEKLDFFHEAFETAYPSSWHNTQDFIKRQIRVFDPDCNPDSLAAILPINPLIFA